MVKKYSFGTPFITGAVVKDIKNETSPLPYFEVNTDKGISFSFNILLSNLPSSALAVCSDFNSKAIYSNTPFKSSSACAEIFTEYIIRNNSYAGLQKHPQQL